MAGIALGLYGSRFTILQIVTTDGWTKYPVG